MKNRFFELLTPAQAHADAMVDILLDEREALTLKQADRINRQLNDKKDLLHKLESDMDALTELLRQGGFSNDKKGFCRFVEMNCGGNDERQQALRFLEQLDQCEKLNKINGSIIHSGLNRVNSVLNLLFHTQRQTHSYDAAGHSVTTNQSSTKIKA